MVSYPSGFDTPATFGTPVGTSPLTSPDHAASHVSIATALGTIEAVVGTTAGTNVLKNFAAGDFPFRINATNTPQQICSGGTFNTFIFGSPTGTGGNWANGTLGTAVLGSPTATGGTFNTFIFGSPTGTGGNWANGTFGTAVLGSPTATGGTFNSFVFGTPIGTGGTWNGATLGTPTIGTITVPGTSSALGFSGGITPAAGSLTDSAGGTLTANVAVSNVFYSVMGTAAGNRTIGTPQNPVSWQSLTYVFKSSGSANGTLVWPTGAFVFSQDTGTPALGTGTSWNYYAWRYNVVDGKWHFMGQSKNIL